MIIEFAMRTVSHHAGHYAEKSQPTAQKKFLVQLNKLFTLVFAALNCLKSNSMLLLTKTMTTDLYLRRKVTVKIERLLLKH